MKYEVLRKIPISSGEQEFHFGKHFRVTLWVIFTNDDGSSWTACFGCSEDYHGPHLVKIGTEFATILLNGKLFIIDLDSKKLILETEDRLGVEGFAMSQEDIVAYDHYESGIIYHCRSQTIRISRFSPEPQQIVFSEIKDGTIYGSIRSVEDFVISFSIDVESGDISYRDQLFHKNFFFFGVYRHKKGTEYNKKEYYVE